MLRSHVTHRNETRHMSQRITSHVSTSHVTQTSSITISNPPHLRSSHLTHTKESRHSSQRVTSHISRCTYSRARRTNQCVASHILTSHATQAFGITISNSQTAACHLPRFLNVFSPSAIKRDPSPCTASRVWAARYDELYPTYE